MKKHHTLLTMLVNIVPLLSAFAETNALIEVKLFKDWVIKGERTFGNLAIKNTGTFPILLAKDAVLFDIGQLDYARQENREEAYRQIPKTNFFSLLPEETHVYEGEKFYFTTPDFSKEMRFTVSIYLGYEPSEDRAIRRLPIEVQRMHYSVKEFWLDSEPLTVNGVVPDSEEYVATVTNTYGARDLMAVTYKNERWLYTKLGGHYYAVCPISITSKIRVEPHDGKGVYKIWDGDKSMIYLVGKSMLLEGPDENNVLGKWTRERKQQAEAENAEVRRKKAAEQK